MAECYITDNPANALVATTAKSVIVATAAAAEPFRVIQFTVGCDATATGTLKVEFLVGTLTGGTTGTAPPVARMNGDGWLAAAQTTISTYTAEPTYTKHASNGALAIKTMILPLPSGVYDIEYPLGREFAVPVSNLLAVRLTASEATNAYTSLAFEE